MVPYFRSRVWKETQVFFIFFIIRFEALEEKGVPYSIGTSKYSVLKELSHPEADWNLPKMPLDR